MSPPYAELHALSHFTFLTGASSPEELVNRAARLGYEALALTDECSVAGVVRAHMAAKECGLKLIIGSEFRLEDGLRLVMLAPTRKAYAELCTLITRGRRAAPKGQYCLRRADVVGACSECLLLWLPGTQADPEEGQWVRHHFDSRAWIAVELLATGRDRERLQGLIAAGRELGLPLTASGDVHMHTRQRRILQDTLTAIRLKTTVAAAGLKLYSSGERHLRTREYLQALYPDALLDETRAIAARCCFTLDELRYEYPQELVPEGETPASHLRRLTCEGMLRRWPEGAGRKTRRLIEHELRLISELKYEPYFLTVCDIVCFARSRGILCQGRGSAANSAVCFCLGITEVDPARMEMLFERFISKERNEPPDIDVDFEHDRREEVIQYVYEKYGRDRAALAATVITYRPRSAMRDVGKALGLDDLQTDRLARAMQWWDGQQVDDDRVREAGFDPQNRVIRKLLVLVRMLLGFPRHLSQHVGGFVISAGQLAELVPTENAAMPDRTVIQWDKNDLDDLGLLKVDLLGLGMLSAIRRSFELIRAYSGRELTLASVPAEDPEVYRMISCGDTLGVFQIESRAQMAMLPRLKPKCFYDLVIEVAIIRPGPIQGDMVHPYLRRRNGEEPVTYPSEEVRQVLERTLGVPIFQEQVMQLAVVAAGFSPGEADRLRRAMAAWKRRGGLGPFEDRLINGMRQRGYSESFARQIFNQIKGFGEYGFPESHSASFALLVYVSAWLKRYEPAAFTCALLNSQPMGFYAPSQLVQAAARQDVEIKPADVTKSDWNCTLVPGVGGQPVLHLGLRLVKHLSESAAERLIEARSQRDFRDVQDLAERARLNRRDLDAFAAADSLRKLAGHRHRASWAAAGFEKPDGLFREVRFTEALPMLTAPTESENIVADFRSMNLTLRRHPLCLLRTHLTKRRLRTARELWQLSHGTIVRTAGLVITRQRPGSANGVTFVTLEDETGYINLIVWERVMLRQRRILLESRLMGAEGTVQREGGVLHVVVRRLEDHTDLLGSLATKSRDFH